MTKAKKKFKRALNAYLVDSYTEGFDKGYDAGYESGLEAGIQDEHARDEVFQEGVKAERNRIQAICAMQMKWAEEQNKGSEYMKWKSMMELTVPIEVDFSDEAYQRNLEADGF